MKIKDVGMFFVGVVAVLYMINPTGGLLEIISDLIPFVGNMDEAAATALFIGVLGYFGIDVKGFFGKGFFVRDINKVSENKKEDKDVKIIETKTSD